MHIIVLATLPIYYVRNSGGLGDLPQAVNDFKEMEKEILAFCAELRAWKPEKFGWLTPEEAKRFVLQPRLAKAGRSKPLLRLQAKERE